MAVETPDRADDSLEPIPAPPAYEPPSTAEPPAAPPVPPVPAVAASPAPAARRRRNPMWYATLLVGAVVVLGGFGLLYGDDVSWQHRASDLSQQNSALHQQLLTSQTSLSDTQQQVSTLQGELQHPHVGIWNVEQQIKGADWYLAGGVPDTFTYHLQATSNGPMTISILTFEQFAAAIECVDNGGGSTHWCMHHSRLGTVKTWPDVTSVSYDFHLAEGCADYLAVFTSATTVTVHPDVSVTYNPAQTFTGSCA